MYDFIFYVGVIIVGAIALTKIQVPDRRIPFCKQKLKWLFFILAWLAIIVPAIFSILEFRQKGKIEKIESKSGELKSFENPIGLIVIGQRGCDTSLVAKFTNFFSPNSEFGFAEENRTLLKAYLRDDRLVLDAIIRDSNGKVLATITDGYWKNYCDTCEYNNDENGFELITRDGEIIFQLDYYENVLYFAGFLGFQKGGGFYYKPIFKDGQISESIGVVVGISGDYTEHGGDLPMIFHYPREKNLGVRRKK